MARKEWKVPQLKVFVRQEYTEANEWVLSPCKNNYTRAITWSSDYKGCTAQITPNKYTCSNCAQMTAS
jgi:hypothetical protein